MRFVLIAFQRTGTNLLREVINSNAGMFMFAEVLSNSDSPVAWRNFLRTDMAQPYPPYQFEDAVELVDSYWRFLQAGSPSMPEEAPVAGDTEEAREAKGERWLGIDVKYNQLQYLGPVLRQLVPEFGAPLYASSSRHPGTGRPRHEPAEMQIPLPFLISYLKDHRIPIIHLTRSNAVHISLSSTIAAKRRLWHRYDGVTSDQPVELDPQRVIEVARYATAERRVFEFLTRGRPRNVECRYDDLVEDVSRADESGRLPQDTLVFSRIAQRFNVPNDFRYDGHLKKAVDKPYSEIISNHREIVRAIARTELAPFAATI